MTLEEIEQIMVQETAKLFSGQEIALTTADRPTVSLTHKELGVNLVLWFNPDNCLFYLSVTELGIFFSGLSPYTVFRKYLDYKIASVEKEMEILRELNTKYWLGG